MLPITSFLYKKCDNKRLENCRAPKLFFGRTPTEEVTGDAVRLALDIQLVSLVVSLLPHKSTIFLDMVLENFGIRQLFLCRSEEPCTQRTCRIRTSSKIY